MNLLSLIPIWLRFGLVLAALFAAYTWGRMDGAAPVKVQLERERAQWAQSQAAALAAEIKRSAAIIDELRGNHAEATERAARAESEARAASAAVDTERRTARRVRDASATDLLAARAAIEAAGATRACGPALDAADLRQGVLEWCEGAIGRLGGTVAGLARYADDLKGDDAACRKDYATVTR